MELTSTAFSNNMRIPRMYTCEGENISPPLQISGVSAEARSLVLIVTDPDAPTPDFTHWLVWNIRPDTASIAEGEVPQDAVEGKNDFEGIGWGGPCPPSGMHRYAFHLYALDTRIELPEISNKTDLLSHIGGLILEEALLIGLYTKEHSK